jgi:hypothetical protein
MKKWLEALSGRVLDRWNPVAAGTCPSCPAQLSMSHLFPLTHLSSQAESQVLPAGRMWASCGSVHNLADSKCPSALCLWVGTVGLSSVPVCQPQASFLCVPHSQIPSPQASSLLGSVSLLLTKYSKDTRIYISKTPVFKTVSN